MGLLDKLNIRKKELPSFGNLDKVFLPFAILQDDQTKSFFSNLTYCDDSLMDKVYEETGGRRFVSFKAIKGTHKRKTIEKIKKYPDATYMASFEALDMELYGFNEDLPAEHLEFGQGEFFNEDGFIIQYIKEEPLYNRKYLTTKKSTGILQLLYQSPLGSFVMQQNQINNKIFEIYISEGISEKLLQTLSIALEKSLELEPESIAKKIR